jgi:hypothetical protein
MAITLGNGNITFGDSTTQSSADSLCGVGQSYGGQSRSLGTTYTNGTGKTIWVMTSWSSPIGGATAYFYVNSIVAQYRLQDLYPRLWIGSMVPPGATYYITGPGNFAYWIELR